MKLLKTGKNKKTVIKKSEHYNEIYSNLVKNDSDAIGKVAYAIYKKDKLVWIENKKLELKKDVITNDELKPFHELKNTKTEINRYRKLAEDVLDNSLRIMFNNWLKDVSKKIKPTRTQEVWNGVYKTIIIIIIVNILTFFILSTKFSVEEVYLLFTGKAKITKIDQ